MKPRDGAELLLLAALWGASFLFMRLGAAQFGPVALSGLRVAGAALVLLPIVRLRGEWRALRAHAGPIALLGVTNSALPFVAFSVALVTLDAGLASIFNASAPLFGAAIGWVWLRDRLSRARLVGLGIGFGGVAALAWVKADARGGFSADAPAIAIAACIAASLCYGFSANFARRHLDGVPPMAIAAGSQLSAAIALALPSAALWPASTPAAPAWAALAALSFACTGLAYILYFRLIANTGASNAISVTFLIPAFAIGWGALVLGERPTPAMLAGCAVILLGTALATGVLGRRLRIAR
jgi:drug/metabolite transporter (DMT)-like permease